MSKHKRVSAKLIAAMSMIRRQGAALLYVMREILPRIIRTGHRPVIFSRYTGMGDIVCTIPPARELMKRHPGATFIYNCHPDFAPVPRLAGVADHITSFEPIGIVGHWYRFFLEGFYHFAHGDDTPGRVASELMITEFCRQFDLPVTDQHPGLRVAPPVLERMKSLLASRQLDPTALILIHPGPSWTVKEWPRERWIELVAALRAQGHSSIAQLGVARYVAFNQVAISPIPGTVSLVDALSVEECIAVISLAKVFVGIDSGLLHIAASTRTPSIGLFGSTSPQFFYGSEVRKHFVVTDVECAGCHHRQPRLHWITNCPHEIRCMKTLDGGDVFQSCLATLSASAPP